MDGQPSPLYHIHTNKTKILLEIEFIEATTSDAHAHGQSNDGKFLQSELEHTALN